MPYCTTCRADVDEELDEHLTNSPLHYMCLQCKREFVSLEARRAHYADNFNHHYCDICDVHFREEALLELHLEELHLYCRVCGIFYTSQEAKDAAHAARPHFYCSAPGCTRGFKTENNLVHHARTHLPKNIPCPGKKCKKAFALPADLIHHMESGWCRSRVTRQDVDAAVIAYDRARIITDASRLLPGPDGTYTKRTEPTLHATEETFNGTRFACVLCSRTFRTLESLNAHLRSPAHADEIYKCPTFYGGCAVQFTTLSALTQHVEVGTCGVTTFKKEVHDVVDHITAGMRGLGL